MMISIVFSFFIFVLAIAGLAIGVLLGREPLRGSCGGDAVVNVCPICTKRNEE